MPAAQPRTVTAYVVQQVLWMYNDEYNDRLASGENPSVKTFLDRSKAEAECRNLERTARANWNYYEMGGWQLENHTTYSPDEIRDRLRAAGLHPPQDTNALVEWLAETDFRSDEAQFDAVYEVMNLCRNYEVVPVEITLED